MANCERILTSEKPTLKVRNERIDSVKYWLIVLVIVGHVFEQFKDIPECGLIRKWIYIFHMPLFIFISGYFSQRKDNKSFKISIWKLLEPLIFFQIITTLTKLIFQGSISLGCFVYPWWILWYLLSLIYWRTLLHIIPNNLLNNAKLILIGTLIISILAGYFPFNNILSSQRTLAFIPFFFLGYYMKGKNIYLPNKFKPLSYLFLILTGAIVFYFPQLLGDVSHSQPYDCIYGGLQRLFVFCISVIMSLAFMNICPNTKWTAKQGKLTMQYYIYHALAITPLMIIASKLNIPMSFVSATIYTIVMTIGIGIASRLPYFTKFTNPSSFFKK